MPLRFEFQDGSSLPVPFVEADVERRFFEQEQARVFVNRGVIESVDVVSGQTQAFVVLDGQDVFGGVVFDSNRKGSTTEIIVESFERYARDALPTPPGQRRENVSDDTIVKQAVDDVPQLSRGTINSVASSTVSLIFSHSSQAHKIRQTARATGGRVVYNPDETVDYIESRGSDKTDVTLSPSNQNVIEGFEIDRLSGQENVTHLRMLGAGEGPHQVGVNLIPTDDNGSYGSLTNPVERVDVSQFSSGDRAQWQTKTAKEYTSTDSLIELGKKVLEDAQNESVEVRTTVVNQDVSLGDRFTVSNQSENLSPTQMQVVELVEKYRLSGTKYDVLLSTQLDSRENPARKDREDISNYNLAVEGTAVPLNASGGRQPVSNSNPYQMELYYPGEVKYEHRLNLRVIGLPYRYYASISSTGHSHDISGLEHQHTVNLVDDGSGGNPLSHDHSFSVPRNSSAPSGVNHSHDVGPPGNPTGKHNHSVETTSDPVGYDSDFFLNSLTIADAPTDATSGVEEEFGDNTSDFDGTEAVRGTVNGTVDSNNGNFDFTVNVDLIDGSSGGVIDSTDVNAGSGDVFQASVSAGPSSISASSVSLEVEYDGDIKNTTGTIEVIPNHKHDVSDTSSNELLTSVEQSFDNLTNLDTETEFDQTTLTVPTNESLSGVTSDSTSTLDPGIINNPSSEDLYPNDVQVKINGQDLGVTLRSSSTVSSRWERSVDLLERERNTAFSGLQEGAVNDISVESGANSGVPGAGLGHLLVFVEGDVYRQITGDG